MLSLDDFPAFFEAVWGHRPFDWQTRLLEQVCSAGWPSTLDLPTGSGKTAAMDIALFALALDAFERPEARRQPRRVALVVDRRVVVDQAYHRAVELAVALKEAREGVLARVGDALRTLQDDDAALPVLPAILRGGMPRESEWARTPHQPVLLVSTVDQVGSRLLFRGYGVSDRMKPVHAGLLGRDTLYLLDEVHLSRPFEETLAAVANYGRSKRIAERLPRPLVFVRMSATLADRTADTFALIEAERQQEVLARRLLAGKRALLRKIKTPKDPKRAREALAKACVDEACRLAATAPIVGVIVNRVDTARRVAALAVERLPQGWDVRLMTGCMRPLDRADLQAELLGRIRAGRSRTENRVLLVATQAVEAGADLDFDGLVTESASLDALRQRFGRLDRMGELGSSDAVVLAGSNDVEDTAEPDPIYGQALAATWRWLHEATEAVGDTGASWVDFGIEALDSRLAAMDPAHLALLTTPRSVAPVLTASHLDRWVQTSPIPSADPGVAPFLHGAERGAPDVQVVWRADLEASMLVPDNVRAVREMLTAVPPSTLEALPIPLWTARSWLAALSAGGDERATGSAVAAVADVEGAGEPFELDSSVIAPVAIWRGDGTVLGFEPDDIGPGDTLVVPASYGGLHPRFACWDPDATEQVRDRGDEAQLLQRGRAVVRWSPGALGGWGLSRDLAAGPKLASEDLEERGSEAEREAFTEWRAAALNDEGLAPWAKCALEALGGRSQLIRVGNGVSAWRASRQPRPLPHDRVRRLSGLPVLAEGIEFETASTEDDNNSLASAEVVLDRHLSDVQAWARRFARAITLPGDVANDVELAGRLHDLGKSDPRFQILLHGGDPVAAAVAAEPLAKSGVPSGDGEARQRAQERSGYPSGIRHELTSVALIERSKELRERANDWDLVLHLVASHHGYCRPFAPLVLDRQPVEVKARFEGIALVVSSDHGLVRIDSGVAERFWSLVEQYGWWGLAWLEAIVRLADHRASEQEANHG